MTTSQALLNDSRQLFRRDRNCARIRAQEMSPSQGLYPTLLRQSGRRDRTPCNSTLRKAQGARGRLKYHNVSLHYTILVEGSWPLRIIRKCISACASVDLSLLHFPSCPSFPPQLAPNIYFSEGLSLQRRSIPPWRQWNLFRSMILAQGWRIGWPVKGYSLLPEHVSIGNLERLSRNSPSKKQQAKSGTWR